MCSVFYYLKIRRVYIACRFSCVSPLAILTIIASLLLHAASRTRARARWYIPRIYRVDSAAPCRAAKKVSGAAGGSRGRIWPPLSSGTRNNSSGRRTRRYVKHQNNAHPQPRVTYMRMRKPACRRVCTVREK